MFNMYSILFVIGIFIGLLGVIFMIVADECENRKNFVAGEVLLAIGIACIITVVALALINYCVTTVQSWHN